MVDRPTCIQEQRFGPFDLCEQLGHGALTTVVRAIERESGRVVALKRLQAPFASDPPRIRRFLREARLAQGLHHPNIVRVFGVGQVEGVHYMSMEWIPGQTLAAIVDDTHPRSRVPVGVAIWILRQLLNAIDYVNAGLDDANRPLGIVHRDLSASNVIISPEGDVRVIDFGMAKSPEGRHATHSGIVEGRLGYMAPEVLAGQAADSRSDIFSVAVLAWELLTNQRLFGGSEGEQLAKRAAYRYVPPSQLGIRLSQDVEDLLRVALAKDPMDRWPKASAMAGVLDIVLRRYGRAAGPDAWIAWQQGKSEMLRLGTPDQDSTDRSDLGVLTTLPGTSGIARAAIRGYRFGPHATTVVDPVLDPRERHRLLAAKD